MASALFGERDPGRGAAQQLDPGARARRARRPVCGSRSRSRARRRSRSRRSGSSSSWRPTATGARSRCPARWPACAPARGAADRRRARGGVRWLRAPRTPCAGSRSAWRGRRARPSGCSPRPRPRPPPPRSGASPRPRGTPRRPASRAQPGDLEVLIGALEALGELVPPDLRHRLAEAVREVLLAVRALDRLVPGADREPVRRAARGPGHPGRLRRRLSLPVRSARRLEWLGGPNHAPARVAAASR